MKRLNKQKLKGTEKQVLDSKSCKNSARKTTKLKEQRKTLLDVVFRRFTFTTRLIYSKEFYAQPIVNKTYYSQTCVY